MPEKIDIDAFRAKLHALIADLPEKAMLSSLRPGRLRALKSAMEAAIIRLQMFSKELDPVSQPQYVFDPSNPQVIGELIARTLLLQTPQSLKNIGKFYGSGVYAIYYRGSFPAYAPISGSDTLIYVGKADPATLRAETFEQQGYRLSTRLTEHLKSITAAENLKPDDFDCRYVVVKSAWQETAEDNLIALFKPIWNNETKICYGFGKHGDAAKTRANRRSPWDTLHPGRKWAMTRDNVPNEKSVRQILSEIAEHFSKNPPIRPAK
jgi:hypothetical protein